MTVPLIQLLSTAGDGTGTTEITGDYSSTAETFELHGPTANGDILMVERLMVFMQDTGSIDMENYGASAALTVGLGLEVQTAAGATVIDLTPTPIKTNSDWASYCHDVSVFTFGVGDEALSARWSMNKWAAPSGGIALDDGLKLVLTCNDNMANLVAHRITAQGYMVGKTWNY